LGDRLFVDGGRIEAAVAGFVGDAAHRVDQLAAAAVVYRQAEARAGVGGAHGDGLVHLGQGGGRNAVAAADDPNRDVLPHDRGPLFDHVLFEQVHQKVELALRPFPVLARQAIQGELFQVQAGGFLDGAANAGHAAAVPLDPRQVPPLGPAAVAVHDDRHVPRPAIRGQVGKRIGNSLRSDGHGERRAKVWSKPPL
jgi:hypothetical protein